MALIIPIGFRGKLSIAPKDAMGNPSEIDGVPVWSSSDPSVVVVAADPADPTGLTAFATPAGPLGVAQVQVQVDADMGGGVKAITGLLDCEIVAGETAVVDVSGTLEPTP